MDSALGEANVTGADPYHINQPGMPDISVFYYCGVVLPLWKAENCCGIHLFLQEPYALPAPLDWWLCIFSLDWDQLGGPYGLFWGFCGFRQAGFLSFPLPPCVSPLPVGSRRFFVQMSDAAPAGDSIPPDVMITFWFFCFWSWQLASLFLCFSCSLGNLSPLPKLERFAIILARSRKLQKSICISDLLWDDQFSFNFSL